MSIGSPTAFLLWAILSSIFLGFLVLHLWSYDRFTCLKWSAGRQPGAFKRVMTYSYLATVPLLVAFSIAITIIKYKEGYVMAPDGQIYPRPIALYSSHNRRWLLPLYFVLSVAWSLELVTHLEELTFWLYLLHQGPGKREWFHSWEFRTWYLGSMVSVLGMPITTLVTRKQLETCIAWIFLVGSAAGTATTIFFLYVLIRFPGFLRHVKAGGAEPDVVVRLATFYQLHKIRVMFRFLFTLPFLILALDGLIEGPHVIVSHPFSSDFLLMMGCLGSCISSAITLLIFFPRSITQESGYRAKLQSPFNNSVKISPSGGVIIATTASSFNRHGAGIPPPNYYPQDEEYYSRTDAEHEYPDPYPYPFSFPPQKLHDRSYDHNQGLERDTHASPKSPAAARMNKFRYPGTDDGQFAGQPSNSRSRSRSRRSWDGEESDGESLSGSSGASSNGYDVETDEDGATSFVTEGDGRSVRSRDGAARDGLSPRTRTPRRGQMPTAGNVPTTTPQPQRRHRDGSRTQATTSTPPQPPVRRDSKRVPKPSSSGPKHRDPYQNHDAHSTLSPTDNQAPSESSRTPLTRDVPKSPSPSPTPTPNVLRSNSAKRRNFGLDDIPLSTRRRFSDGPTSAVFERHTQGQGQGSPARTAEERLGVPGPSSGPVRGVGAPVSRSRSVSKNGEGRTAQLHPYVMNFTSPIDLFDENADDLYVKQMDLRRQSTHSVHRPPLAVSQRTSP